MREGVGHTGVPQGSDWARRTRWTLAQGPGCMPPAAIAHQRRRTPVLFPARGTNQLCVSQLLKNKTGQSLNKSLLLLAAIKVVSKVAEYWLSDFY